MFTRPMYDPYRRETLRRRLKAVVVAVVVVAIVALTLWSARSAADHYRRGRQALSEKRYSVALREFNAARVVGFSYRDADALAARAADALVSNAEQQTARQTLIDGAVTGYVTFADARLAEGDVAAAEQALAAARRRVPDGALSDDSSTLVLLWAISQQLSSMGREALADGEWSTAGICATALSQIDPDDAHASRLADAARRGATLRKRLDAARAAARDGRWKRALRVARNVLAEWPGFPGAAVLVRQARAALRPEPSPTPEASVPAAPSPQPTATPTAPPPP